MIIPQTNTAYLRCEFVASSTIERSARPALEVATRLQQPVVFTFNGYDIYVHPCMPRERIVQQYYDAMKETARSEVTCVQCGKPVCTDESVDDGACELSDGKGWACSRECYFMAVRALQGFGNEWCDEHSVSLRVRAVARQLLPPDVRRKLLGDD